MVERSLKLSMREVPGSISGFSTYILLYTLLLNIRFVNVLRLFVRCIPCLLYCLMFKHLFTPVSPIYAVYYIVFRAQ